MGYLDGENLHRDIEYRICLLLAKWFYEQGDNTVVEIREHLKQWAKDNDFYFTVAMNPIATKVITEDMHLADAPVYLNDEDIAAIKERFDTYSEQLIALAVLCYAKAYADDDGKFKISQRMLGHWIGMNKKTVHKYLKRLENAGYISLYEAGETSSWYQKTVVSQLNCYQLCVPYINVGNFTFCDNNVAKLYDCIFLNTQPLDEVWCPIPGYNNWYWINSQGKVKVCERMMNGRRFPSKILRPFQSASGKLYYNLMCDGVQRKVSLEKLQDLALRK